MPPVSWRTRATSTAQMWDRSLDPQPVQQAVVGAPGSADADGELEVDAGAELALQLLAGGRADRLDHAPAGADQDALLRLGLDPDDRAHGDQVRAPLLDLL